MTPETNNRTVSGITGYANLYQNGYTGHNAYGMRAACYANSTSGSATVLDETTFFHAEQNAEKTRVDWILVEDSHGGVARIRAKAFIDPTREV